MPRGSVRALLTLLIVGVVCAQAARGVASDALWTETLSIALAHYFTTRRLLDLTPEQLRRLEAEGLLPREPSPLGLPGFTVRGLILLAFLGLALYLERAGRLREPGALNLFALVGSYVLGILVRGVVAWWTRGRMRPRWWNDLKALAVLLAMGATAAATLTGNAGLLPPAAQHAALALALFYFGSR
jgi:hypothetical protein